MMSPIFLLCVPNICYVSDKLWTQTIKCKRMSGQRHNIMPVLYIQLYNITYLLRLPVSGIQIALIGRCMIFEASFVALFWTCSGAANVFYFVQIPSKQFLHIPDDNARELYRAFSIKKETVSKF